MNVTKKYLETQKREHNSLKNADWQPIQNEVLKKRTCFLVSFQDEAEKENAT